MGLLGNLFSAPKKRKKRRKEREARRQQERLLTTIRGLTATKQRLQTTSLQEKLFAGGLQGSSLGDTLEGQLAGGQKAENQELDIQGTRLDIASLQQKIDSINASFEGIDAVLGIVIGAAGAGGGPSAGQAGTASVGQRLLAATSEQQRLQPGQAQGPGLPALQVEAPISLPAAAQQPVGGAFAARPQIRGTEVSATGGLLGFSRV